MTNKSNNSTNEKLVWEEDGIIMTICVGGLGEEKAKQFIGERGIKLIVDRTEEATKTFNIINEESEEEEGEKNKVIGLFHLTC